MSSIPSMRPHPSTMPLRQDRGFSLPSSATPGGNPKFSGNSNYKKPWKWGIFGSLMLAMAAGSVSLYRVFDKQIEECGAYSWTCPEMEDSLVPGVIRDLGTSTIDMWRSSDPIGKSLLAFMGLLFASLPTAGAYALGHYVQQKRELKDFLTRFNHARQSGGSDTVNKLARTGLADSNPLIRAAVLTTVHSLPMTDKEKTACYLLGLRDPDDTAYQVGREAVHQFVEGKRGEMAEMLGRLESEAPGFYETTSTILIPMKVGNTTTYYPQITTTKHRHEYSTAYKETEQELSKLVTNETEWLTRPPQVLQ